MHITYHFIVIIVFTKGGIKLKVIIFNKCTLFHLSDLFWFIENIKLFKTVEKCAYNDWGRLGKVLILLGSRRAGIIHIHKHVWKLPPKKWGKGVGAPHRLRAVSYFSFQSYCKRNPSMRAVIKEGISLRIKNKRLLTLLFCLGTTKLAR